MSRSSRDRASKLREYHDKLQEWKETGSKEASGAVVEAMRKYDQKTFERAVEHADGDLSDEKSARDELTRKFNVRVTKKDKENGTD